MFRRRPGYIIPFNLPPPPRTRSFLYSNVLLNIVTIKLFLFFFSVVNRRYRNIVSRIYTFYIIQKKKKVTATSSICKRTYFLSDNTRASSTQRFIVSYAANRFPKTFRENAYNRKCIPPPGRSNK